MRRGTGGMAMKVCAVILAGVAAVFLYFYFRSGEEAVLAAPGARQEERAAPQSAVSSARGERPEAKTIGDLAHAWQSFNNCSSVGLMIALSHWGVKDTQEAIAEATRPWNNPRGDNDDKSVTLYELADYARERHGLATYVRPNGTIELLKEFVANGIPVVARTLMYPDQDIVHYRVVRGYGAETILESDGIGGPDVSLTDGEWMHIWKDFNYSYLIVVPPEKRALVERILGSDADEKAAWQGARARAERELAKNPDDALIHYNLATAAFYLGDYEGAVREFEKIEPQLTRRKLWYQHEPIDAYFKLGNYDRVLALTSGIINDNNKSVSELYVMRGKIFESRGDIAAARAEYEKAVMYHQRLQSAKEALAGLPR